MITLNLVKNKLAVAFLENPPLADDAERINAIPGKESIYGIDEDGDSCIKHWLLPKSMLRDLFENWHGDEIAVGESAAALCQSYYTQLANIEDLPPVSSEGLEFLRKPKPWQMKYICINKGKRNLICALNIGFGKTLAVLERAKLVEGRTDFKLLIICPKNVMTNWQSEVRLTYDLPSFIFWEEGKNVPKLQAVLKDQQIVISSYEMVKHLQKHFRPEQIIIDEIHSFKTPKAERTKQVKAIRKAFPDAGVQGASGTLAHNQPTDMYEPIDIVSPGLLGSRAAFKAKYMRASDHVYIDKVLPSGLVTQIKIPVGFKPINIDKLHEQIKPVVYTVDPTEFQTFEDYTDYIVVAMKGEQKRLYEKTLTEFLDAVDCGSLMPGEQLSVLSRLRQLAEGAFHAEEAETEDSGKLDFIEEMLEQKDPEERVIIWSCFRKGLEILHERHADKGAVLFTGQVSDNRKKLGVYSFQGCRTEEEYEHFRQLKSKTKDWQYEPGKASILLGIMHQSTIGFNLNRSSKQYILTSDWLDSTLSQTLGRIKRLDNTAPYVESVFLHSKDSDEHERLLATYRKGQIAAQVLQGKNSDLNLLRIQEINRLRKLRERL